MKFKKWLTGFCVMAVTLTAAMPVMAAETKAKEFVATEKPAMFYTVTHDFNLKDMNVIDMKANVFTEEQKAEMAAKFANLTAEEKADMEARRVEAEKAFAEAKAKWNALTAAQKEAVYKLEEEKIDLEIKSLKTMSELGLTDKAQADKMIKLLTDSKALIRNSEFLPLMMQPGVKVKVKIEDGVPGKTDTLFITTETAAVKTTGN